MPQSFENEIYAKLILITENTKKYKLSQFFEIGEKIIKYSINTFNRK